VKCSRREFIKKGALGAAAVSLLSDCSILDSGSKDDSSVSHAYGPQPIVGHSKGIPTRVLGKTGEVVTILAIGGAHANKTNGEAKDNSAAIALINRAYELGITYFDTAHDYYGDDHRNERALGAALSSKDRSTFFLNTKIYSRDYDSASRDIDLALKLLKVDAVDCLMLHGVDYKSTTKQIFGPDGSMRALIKARDDGRAKLLGLSGHANPQSLNMAMNAFDFDVALMAINPADYRRLPFENSCYRKAIEQNMGIVNMKTLGGLGEMIKSEKHKSGVFTLQEMLNYSWSLKGHATLLGMESIEQLETAVAAAKRYKPITPEQKLEMEERSKSLNHGNCLNFRVQLDW
jgi:uncharacterized protein